jgi:putative oxidoreductase
MLKKIFAPGNDTFSTSLALLMFRLWLGLTLMLNHGLAKLEGYKEMASSFADPLGIGHAPSLALAIFAEVFASGLIVLGLATRFASLVLIINMAVAFFMVHKRALSGQHSGELAFIYLAGYVVLLLAGPGKISLDSKVFGGRKSTKSAEEK